MGLKPTRQTVFILYDSKNEGHLAFLKEVEEKGVMAENIRRYPDLDYVMLDVSNEAEVSDVGTEDFMSIMKITVEDVKKKKRPSTFFRGDARITPMRPGLLTTRSEFFPVKVTKEMELVPVKTLDDLTVYLAKVNASIGQTLIIYAPASNDDAINPTTKIGFRLMRSKTR